MNMKAKGWSQPVFRKDLIVLLTFIVIHSSLKSPIKDSDEVLEFSFCRSQS